MPTFAELQLQIRELLAALPTIAQSDMRHALVETARLDLALQQQLNCDATPANFIPQLVGACSRYGNLNDGRDALAAVLDAAKSYVNVSQRAVCDELIARLRLTPRPAPAETPASAAESPRAANTTITQTAGDHAIQIGQVTGNLTIKR